MRWNTQACEKFKLYLILDRGVHSYDELLKIASEAMAGGVDILQLRDKAGTVRDILEFSRAIRRIIGNRPVPYILNDRVDLAILAKADGVHVGQDDIPVQDARRLMGEGVLVGVSCQTLEHVQLANQAGADYIGFGSVFSTQTKPDRQPMNLDLLEKIVRDSRVPVFPIGGITVERLESLRVRGVTRVAVCRAISQAVDVAAAVKHFKAGLMDN